MAVVVIAAMMLGAGLTQVVDDRGEGGVRDIPASISHGNRSR